MAPNPAVPTFSPVLATHGLYKLNSPPQMPLQVTSLDYQLLSQVIPQSSVPTWTTIPPQAPVVPTSLPAVATRGLSKANLPPQMPQPLTTLGSQLLSQVIPSSLGLIETTMLVPPPAALTSLLAVVASGLNKPNSPPAMLLQVTNSDAPSPFLAITPLLALTKTTMVAQALAAPMSSSAPVPPGLSKTNSPLTMPLQLTTLAAQLPSMAITSLSAAQDQVLA